MKILLTNDDGIYSPGLHALREELSTLGHVTTVAPQMEQSGVGLSITYLHPIMAKEYYQKGEHIGWAVGGSPADCVKLGVIEYCDGPPDLVVSGINSGANVGINVLYSGTVAGAIEGAFFGITSVAVSLSQGTPPDYPAAAVRARNVIDSLLKQDVPTGSLWNLNFPDSSATGPKGLKLVNMGAKRYEEVMEKRIDPRGRPYFWSGINPIDNHEMVPETDVHELTHGYATLTPLSFDMTNTERVTEHRKNGWVEGVEL